MHPELRGGYHEILGNYPPESSEETVINIGRFNDGNYHLIGYFPKALSFCFSSASETNLDLGIVRLPGSKRSLRELVQGEVFNVEAEDHEPFPIRFLRYR